MPEPSASEKAFEISKHPTFQSRVRWVTLKEVNYKIETSDKDATKWLEAGKQVWASVDSLQTVAMLILSDPNLLGKCAINGGGDEISDAEIQAKVQAGILNWGLVLA